VVNAPSERAEDGLNERKETKTNKNVGNNQKQQNEREIQMPSEIFDLEKFVEISERAEYCAVKRLKDIVKLISIACASF
jgi:hypothetical protein